MSPKIVDREQKKLQIIGSAFNVLQEKGYKNTNMADIAVEAGMGKGTLYEYFGSKEELVAATIETVIRLSQDFIYRELDTIEDPEQKLRSFIRSQADIFIEETGIFRLFIEITAGAGHTARLDRMAYLAQAYERTIDRVEGILKEGMEKGVFKKMDTRSTATLLVCIMDGLQLPYGLDEKMVNVEGINNVIEEMVLNYVT